MVSEPFLPPLSPPNQAEITIDLGVLKLNLFYTLMIFSRILILCLLAPPPLIILVTRMAPGFFISSYLLYNLSIAMAPAPSISLA